MFKFALRGVSRTATLGSIVTPRVSTIKYPSTSFKLASIVSFQPQARFNSTGTSAQEAVAKAADAASSIEKKFDTSLGFDDPTGIVDQVTTALTSDQFGYLKSVGLNDSWWPRDIIETIFETTHVLTGLPWWATIAVTALGIRLLLFPVFVYASDKTARAMEIRPIMTELRKELTTAQASGDTKALQITNMKIRKITKMTGASQGAVFLPLMIQATYGISSFFAVREMAEIPVQGFSDQGTLWFTDLAAADPFLGLQLISAVVYTASFLYGGETGTTQFSPNVRKAMMALPFLSILVTYDFSAAVMLLLSCNGFLSVIQGKLLNSPAFRKRFGLYPMPKPNASANSGGLFSNFKDTMKTMDETSSVKAGNDIKAKNAVLFQKARAKSGRVIIDHQLKK